VKVLFDQGTPVPLRRLLPGHDVSTAYEMGWSTLMSGELLAAAEAAGFADFAGEGSAGRRSAVRVLGSFLGRPARVDVVQHMCYTRGMSAKNPRIHAVLEPPLYGIVKSLARKHGSSLSQEAHDLIREAVELHEDRALDDLAESRRSSWNSKRALTAAEVRAQLARR